MTAQLARRPEGCATLTMLSQRRTAPRVETERDPAILQAKSLAELTRIHSPQTELVIWDRKLKPDLLTWLEALPETQSPDGRLLANVSNCRAAFTKLLDDASTPSDSLREAFQHDLMAITEAFCRVMATDAVDIRLETVVHDGCWKFHRDNVPARLLTTYRGPGTDWVRPEHAADALAQQKRYAGPVERFPDNAVGLFKGSKANNGTGIVHRSPPIIGTGALRILLCLNLPSAASPELWAG